MQMIQEMITIVDSTIESLKNSPHHSHKATNTKPSFKPNPNLGEGEADPGELDYRYMLIALLSGIYLSVTKIVKDSDLTLKEKTTQLDEILNKFQEDSYKLINRETSRTFKAAVTDANQTLQGLSDQIKKTLPGDTTRLNAIQDQQIANVEDITQSLRGRLLAGLHMDEVNEIYRDNPTYDYLNEAFQGSQNRLDGMGMYGYLQSDMQGGLTTLIAGAAVIGTMVVADWVSVGDDRVCDDCLDLEAGGPYPVVGWPEEPHFGCRCSRENERLEI